MADEAGGIECKQQLDDYSYELGPIRPPSEGQDCSLLILASRNCPWNKCEFCSAYKGNPFGYRGVAEIKRDIDVAKMLSERLKAASWKLGYGGHISNEVVTSLIQDNLEVYGQHLVDSRLLMARFHVLINVANWLSSGGRTAFLQDADSVIMRTPELVEVIRYLKDAFPSIERVTSYARSKTVAKKSLEELKELHRVGLSRVHIGLESGNDEVLNFMNKGVTATGHIEGGRKVVESGISLSEYVMPGLGGRKWSQAHALDTARVLSEIDPDFIRLRSIIVRRGTGLYEKLQSGEFEELTEDAVIAEIGLLIEHLDCHSYLASDQMSNLLFEVEGRLPEEKEAMLRIINDYLAMPPMGRMKLRLERRLRSYLAVYGKLDKSLDESVSEAFESMKKESPDSEVKVAAAIAALKNAFV